MSRFTIPIVVTHWAKSLERTKYLATTLRAIREEMGEAVPIVVSFESPKVSPAFEDSTKVLKSFPNVAQIINGPKSRRVESNLDFAFDEVKGEHVFYIQDDFVPIPGDWQLDKFVRFMIGRGCDCLRFNVAAPFDKSVRRPLAPDSFLADEIDLLDPNGVHYYSHNPAIHARSLRGKVGRYPWEWKYDKRCQEIGKAGDLEICATKENRFVHIGDERTIPANEQRLHEDLFAIPLDLIFALRRAIPDGSRLVEFGSGNGTAALANYFDVTSIEESRDFCDREPRATYYHAPIVDRWYDRQIVANCFADEQGDHGPFDAILIDGPNSANGDRALILLQLGSLLTTKPKVIAVDDTHRQAEDSLAIAVQQLVEGERERFTAGDRSFDLITPR